MAFDAGATQREIIRALRNTLYFPPSKRFSCRQRLPKVQPPGRVKIFTLQEIQAVIKERRINNE